MPATTYAANLYSAWSVVKLEAEDALVGLSEPRASIIQDAIALIEPGIRLLELSAAYREAHAAYVAAEAEATATLNQPESIWAKARAAERKLFARRDALLSAALDIT